MRILRQINGNRTKDGIQNEEILLKIEMTPIDEKMRESYLRWFGHVQRRAIYVPVRKNKLIRVEGMKKGKEDQK